LHYSLVLVGAHDGSRMEQFISRAVTGGEVLLIEPVPFLFERLTVRYAALPRVRLRRIAVAAQDREVEFIAPKPTAYAVAEFGDQIGSLVSGHAVGHRPALAQHIETLRVPALCYDTLVRTEEISSLDLLFTDLEGMDTELLPTFPFSKLLPKQIIFEFKHSDGVMHVGPKLANALLLLDDLGYRVKLVDHENLMATHRSALQTPAG
jgi:FkbM family methyltransferase